MNDPSLHGASRPRSDQTNMLLDHLFYMYEQDGIHMPYTMEDFRLDYLREHLAELSPAERLKGMATGEILEGRTPEQIQQLLAKLKAIRSRAPVKSRRRK